MCSCQGHFTTVWASKGRTNWSSNTRKTIYTLGTKSCRDWSLKRGSRVIMIQIHLHSVFHRMGLYFLLPLADLYHPALPAAANSDLASVFHPDVAGCLAKVKQGLCSTLIWVSKSVHVNAAREMSVSTSPSQRLKNPARELLPVMLAGGEKWMWAVKEGGWGAFWVIM